MREIESTLQNRLLQALQTKSNNANPSMEVIAIRPRTPIFHSRFWQESIVAADETAVCTSVAVRKPGANANRVFVAFVNSAGTLIVKSAAIMNPVSSMVWTVEETIDGCIVCALEFEGRFRHDGQNVAFYTDEIPYLFYTTTAGALKWGLLGGPYETIVAANVTAIDAINGVSNTFDAQNQGFFVFYIINGMVYYNTFLDGEWLGQEQVTIAPDNAVAIKAERTFDWRIVLHVTDNTGTLFEVFSKMEATGWNSTEFLEITDISALAGMIAIEYSYAKSQDHHLEIAEINAESVSYATYSPTLLSAENIATATEDPENPGEYYDDYGYRVMFGFDQWIPNAADYPESFKLTDDYGVSWYGQSAVVNGRFVTVTFTDFNNAGNPITATALAGNLTNGLVNLTETSIEFNATGLVPTEIPAPALTQITNYDELTLILAFDLPITGLGDAEDFSVDYDDYVRSPQSPLLPAPLTQAGVGVVDSVVKSDKAIIEDVDLTAAALSSCAQLAGTIVLDSEEGTLGAITTSSGNHGDSTITTVTLPTVNYGDLLVIFLGKDDEALPVTCTTDGWTKLMSEQDPFSLVGSIFYKISDGTETTVGFTHDSEAVAWIAAAMAGAVDPVVSSAVQADTGYPNPPELSTGYDTGTHARFFAFVLWDYYRTLISYPTNMPDNHLTERYNASSGCGVAIASCDTTDQTFDPNAFQINSTDQTMAWTMAVRAGQEYDSAGYFICEPFALGSVAEDLFIKLNAVVPDGTSVELSYGINTSAVTVPTEWTGVDPLEIIDPGEDLTGKYLWVKVSLATTNSTITPVVSSVQIMAWDSHLVQLNLTEAGRLRYPEGDITVGFDGTMTGQGGGLVESFL